MAAKQPVRLTRRFVDALRVSSGDIIVWDCDLPGFGIRVYSSGRKVWCVQTRGPQGGPKRRTLGGHGELTPDQARRMAAVAIDRIKQGLESDPLQDMPEPTVADLAERYMTFHVKVNCRPKTVETFGQILRSYIVPELGRLVLSEVSPSHVSGLHHRLRDKPGQANLMLTVLSGMFRLAEDWGMKVPGRNPVRSVRRYRQRSRARFLSPDEYRRLGDVLAEAESDGSVMPSAIHAIRLLLLTGCRRNEIVTLRWDDVDRTTGEIRLRDAKTGLRHVPLTPAVESVLASIPRIRGNPWVLAGRKSGGHFTGLGYFWERIRRRADMEDLRIHDLRHSYASRALALGEGLSMIGKLLGHRQIVTTARYAHLMRDAERAAVAKVGGSIGADILFPRREEPATVNKQG